MRLTADEKALPRIHLIGTLVVVLCLTLGLAAFFSWHNFVEQRAAFKRIEQAGASLIEARLSAEMQSAVSFIDFTRSRTEDVLRASITEQVDTVMQVVQSIYERESKQRPAAEVQRLIVEALRPVRFYEGRGYYFIDDLQGKFVLLPTAPQFEGKTILDNQDDTGHHIMRGLIEAAGKPRGEGFSRYRWYSPDDPKQMSDKLAYVRHFAPYDWLIGTGDYTYKWEQMQQKEALNRLRPLRFGESGYLAVLNREGRTLLAPANAALEGQHFNDMQPVERLAVAALFHQATAKGALVNYEWPNEKTGKLGSKTALARIIEPWGWIVIATMYDDELEGIVASEIERHNAWGSRLNLSLLIATLAALAFGVLASLLFSRWSKRLFVAYYDQNKAQEEALRAQADELKTLSRAIEQSPASIVITDVEGCIRYVNPKFEQITGYSSAEVAGKNSSILSSGDKTQEEYRLLWQTILAGAT